MTEQVFLEQLRDLLQMEKPVTPETELASLREWDSLAWMLLIAFADKERLHPVKLSSLRTIGTVHELYLLLVGGSDGTL